MTHSLLTENSYGVVKRLRVIEAWLQEIATARGTQRLRILDYGCGTGDHLTAPMAALGHEVVGVDSHAPSIEQARREQQRSNLTFRACELDDLVAEGHTFDVVVCSEVLEHVYEPREFLTKLQRLTDRAGAVIITTPNGRGSFEILCACSGVFKRTGIHEALRAALLAGRRLSAALRGRPRPQRPLDAITTDADRGFLNVDSGHVQFFTVGRLTALFRDAGLRIEARRARTFLCGPYADAMFALCPWRETLFRWNNAAADRLPFSAAADWMFLLRPTP